MSEGVLLAVGYTLWVWNCWEVGTRVASRMKETGGIDVIAIDPSKPPRILARRVRRVTVGMIAVTVMYWHRHNNID